MRLLAISDLHLSHAANREGLEALPAHPDDWLIVAGDVGEKPDHLVYALDRLTTRFAKVIWTPGNHDLWCPPDASDRTRGQARYDELVAICRSYGVSTPEDPYTLWPHPAHLPISSSPHLPISPPPHLPISPPPHLHISPSPHLHISPPTSAHYFSCSTIPSILAA